MNVKPEMRIDGNVTPYASDNSDKIREKCMEEISSAGEAGQDTAMVTSVKMADRPSQNFVNINAQLDSIMAHLKSGRSPEKICILCPNDETMKEYMVVYNFYYAESKADRMNDDRWD